MNPKKINTRFFVLLLAAMSLLVSCSNYGKKVKVAGTKGEVFYKGDGVTEADATKLGNFMKEVGYFDSIPKSVQIKKVASGYEVRMVVDMEKVKKEPTADDGFTLYGAKISKDVFNGSPVTIILCDDKMKDLKTYAFKPEVLETPLAKKTAELKEMNQKVYEKNTLYFSKDVTDEEATGVFEYLKKNEFFTAEGNNDIIVKKGADESAQFEFPVNNQFATTEGFEKIDAFVRQMKTDLFANIPVSFQVLNEELKPIKTFTY